MIVFISAESDTTIPPVEEMAKGKFLLENSKGICVSPPGLGVLNQIEKELRRNITKLDVAELCGILPQLILEDLQLAKEVEMKPEDKQIYLRIQGSAYGNLYTEKSLKSVRSLGCPLVSAIACAIAKTTGKPVTIQKGKFSPENQTVEIWYRIAED